MKAKLIFVLLTLGFCCFNLNAQVKQLKKEKNGFQWYRTITDYTDYGAESLDGKTIIPSDRNYTSIIYIVPKTGLKGYFLVSRNKKEGVCNLDGEEIIAPDKYDNVSFISEKGHIGWYSVKNNGLTGACDITGKEIIPCNYNILFYGKDNRFNHMNKSGNMVALNIKLDSNGKLKSEVQQHSADAQSKGLLNKIKNKAKQKTENKVNEKKKKSNISNKQQASEQKTTSKQQLAQQSSKNSSKQQLTTKSNKAAENDEVPLLDEFLDAITDYYDTPENRKLEEEKKARNAAADALSSYSDTQYFGFKGKVKKCHWFAGGHPSVQYPWPRYVINFSLKGKVISDEFKFDRNSNGRIIQMESINKTYKFYYDSNDRIIRVEEISLSLFGEDIVTNYYYTYNSDDRIISAEYKHSILGEIKYKFSSFTCDSNGNWIKCNCLKTDKTGKSEWVVKREIEYY